MCTIFLTFSGCSTDEYSEDGNSNGNEDTLIPSDSTNPDAAVARFVQYLSRQDYEELFNERYGVGKRWQELHEGKKGEDFYSYDNLKAGIREISNFILENDHMLYDGIPSTWNYKVYVTDKRTGARTLINDYSGGEFDQPYNAQRPRKIFITDFGDFLNGPTENDRKREIAALLANMTQETSGGEGFDRLYYGLYFNEEIGHGEDMPSPGAYADSSSASINWPAVPEASYHGRGPIQLTWNYNYGYFSALYFGDKNILLKNPERVVKDSALAWATAIWFWMAPQPPKPSCHEVLMSNWIPTPAQQERNWQQGFGATIMVINGGLEGDKTEEEDFRIATRVGMYKRLTERNGANIAGEKLDTAGMTKL